MCFSMSASFGAGVVLSTIGVITIKKTQNRSQLAFASIPLIFALQQISEGFVWLSLQDVYFSVFEVFFTYSFLFIAQVVWPFWVPLASLLIEKDRKLKMVHGLFLAIGVVLAAYLAYCLIVYHVEANIEGYHIAYKQYYPDKLRVYGGAMYLIATIFPLLFSALKGMKALGLTIFVSYIVSYIFYEDYVLSVWCFFSSLISIVVLIIVLKNRTEKTKQPSSASL